MTCQHNTVTYNRSDYLEKSMIQDLLIEAISHDRMHKKLNELKLRIDIHNYSLFFYLLVLEYVCGFR